MHAVIATPLAREDLAPHHLDGFGAALHPAVLLQLAGAGGQVGVLDLTLVAGGRGGAPLPALDGFEEHPHVRDARALREQVRVHGDHRGLVTIASGLAGRLEMSIETLPALHGSGAGRSLIADALTLVPAGALVFAAVSPGNARSLRAFIASGFFPLASEILISPAHPPPDQAKAAPRSPKSRVGPKHPRSAARRSTKSAGLQRQHLP